MINQPIDLKSVERKAWRTNYQDGFTELGWGFMLLALALAPWLDTKGLHLPWNMLLPMLPAFAIPPLGKKLVATPRIGRVTFGPLRRLNRRRTARITAVAVVLTVLWVLMSVTKSWPAGLGSNLPGLQLMSIIGLIVIISISGLAYLLDFPNLFILGLVVGCAVPLAELLRPVVGSPYSTLLVFGLGACFFFGLGAGMLIRFLRGNPQPTTKQLEGVG